MKDKKVFLRTGKICPECYFRINRNLGTRWRWKEWFCILHKRSVVNIKHVGCRARIVVAYKKEEYACKSPRVHKYYTSFLKIKGCEKCWFREWLGNWCFLHKISLGRVSKNTKRCNAEMVSIYSEKINETGD